MAGSGGSAGTGGMAGSGGSAGTGGMAGVGAECTVDPSADPPSTCPVVETDIQLECLTQFKGGYCGLEDCEGDVDCPDGSACVTYDDGTGPSNYCFRECQDKPECNLNRSPDNESNCVGSITFVDPRNERKACEPPSAGL
jgi:hypothetical protein